MDPVKKGEGAISFEERASSFVLEYKIPLILGFVGIVFILSSVLLLSKRNKPSSVTFIEQTSTPSASSSIVIDIQGGVQNPGVYELSVGDRIGDLIVKSGGLSSSADREWIAKNLNQAARLQDGTKVYIPRVGEPIADTVQGSTDILGISSDSVVDINLATQTELENLPGIGPVSAQKIISGRPYGSTEELKTKKVLGNATYEKLKDLIRVY